MTCRIANYFSFFIHILSVHGNQKVRLGCLLMLQVNYNILHNEKQLFTMRTYKPLLLVSFLICILISCKKKDAAPIPVKDCYHCQIVNAGYSGYKDTCVNHGDIPAFRDAQGNNLNYLCTPK
jgi:hypothetical protein